MHKTYKRDVMVDVFCLTPGIFDALVDRIFLFTGSSMRTKN